MLEISVKSTLQSLPFSPHQASYPLVLPFIAAEPNPAVAGVAAINDVPIATEAANDASTFILQLSFNYSFNLVSTAVGVYQIPKKKKYLEISECLYVCTRTQIYPHRDAFD